MRDYGFTRDYILYELPNVEGWALSNWSRENTAWSEFERATDGYIAQERDKLGA